MRNVNIILKNASKHPPLHFFAFSRIFSGGWCYHLTTEVYLCLHSQSVPHTLPIKNNVILTSISRFIGTPINTLLSVKSADLRSLATHVYYLKKVLCKSGPRVSQIQLTLRWARQFPITKKPRLNKPGHKDFALKMRHSEESPQSFIFKVTHSQTRSQCFTLNVYNF